MSKAQIGVLSGAALLFCLLYFVFDTKPPNFAGRETSRALNAQTTSIAVLKKEADAKLSDNQRNNIIVLEKKLEAATEGDSVYLATLKELSGAWYRLGAPAVAGFYAERVAETSPDETSWGIAGTTFSLCLQRVPEGKERTFCREKAISAYDNAISLATPEQAVQHRVNRALVYTIVPPPDNPMKGILQLRELNEQHPNSVLVINQLARLGIQTGQYQRAIERLEQALAIESDNTTSTCLLATAYEGAGQSEAAASWKDKCLRLRAAASE